MVRESRMCTDLDSVEQSKHLKYCARLLYCCHQLFHEALLLELNS